MRRNCWRGATRKDQREVRKDTGKDLVMSSKKVHERGKMGEVPLGASPFKVGHHFVERPQGALEGEPGHKERGQDSIKTMKVIGNKKKRENSDRGDYKLLW